MANKEEARKYLREHIAYEVMMLRYGVASLGTLEDQLAWNAHYESCVVHGRSLYEFLTNDADSRNFVAKNYSDEQADKTKVLGLIAKINAQVIHLTKDRLSNHAKQLQAADVARLANWLEKGLSHFLAHLRPEYKNCWDPELADPSTAGKTAENIPRSQSSFPTFHSSKPIEGQSKPDDRFVVETEPKKK